MASVQTLVISAIIFLTLFLGSVIVINNYGEVYAVNYDRTKFGNDTNATQGLGDIYNLTKDFQSTFQNQTSNSNTPTENFFQSGLNALRLTIATPGILLKTITYMFIQLQIPPFVQFAISAVIIFVFAAAVIAAYIGRRIS